MIQSKINVNGKSVIVCEVEKKETISTLSENQSNKNKKRVFKTYHASDKKNKDSEDNKLKLLLLSLVSSKQKFEVALLGAKLKLEEFKKFLSGKK